MDRGSKWKENELEEIWRCIEGRSSVVKFDKKNCEWISEENKRKGKEIKDYGECKEIKRRIEEVWS